MREALIGLTIVAALVGLSIACEVQMWQECRRVHPWWYCAGGGGR